MPTFTKIKFFYQFSGGVATSVIRQQLELWWSYHAFAAGPEAGAVKVMDFDVDQIVEGLIQFALVFFVQGEGAILRAVEEVDRGHDAAFDHLIVDQGEPVGQLEGGSNIALIRVFSFMSKACCSPRKFLYLRVQVDFSLSTFKGT